MTHVAEQLVGWADSSAAQLAKEKVDRVFRGSQCLKCIRIRVKVGVVSKMHRL